MYDDPALRKNTVPRRPIHKPHIPIENISKGRLPALYFKVHGVFSIFVHANATGVLGYGGGVIHQPHITIGNGSKCRLPPLYFKVHGVF